MGRVQASPFVDENAPNISSPHRVLKPKKAATPSVDSSPFQSPPRRGALLDATSKSAKKTPVRSSPLNPYATRSSSKKARVIPSAPPHPPATLDCIKVNDDVTVVGGSYAGKKGVVKGISDRTYKLSIDGKITGNIPKASVVKGVGGSSTGAGGGVQVRRVLAVRWRGGGGEGRNVCWGERNTANPNLLTIPLDR